MDLQGIAKRAWRARIIEIYGEITKFKRINTSDVFFTLGGSARKSNSELNYLIERNFLQSKQYVSVEKNLGLHRSNCFIKGPSWLYGEWLPQFEKWCKNDSRKIAIVSCDLMCGAETAMPTITGTLYTLYNQHKLKDNRKTMISFNICSSLRISNNTRSQLPPVWDTIKSNNFVGWCMRKGLTLIDKFPYHNKPIGRGAENSTMETISFAW